MDDEDDVVENECDFEVCDVEVEGGDDECEGCQEVVFDVDDFCMLLQVEFMVDMIQYYLNCISVKLLLIVEEEQCYLCFVKVGEFEVWQVMIECNLCFVVSIVKGYLNCGVLLFDLIEEGNFGLMYVIEKFDLMCGFCFLIYVMWWIWQSIEWVIMNQVCMVCLFVYVICELNQVLCVKCYFEKNLMLMGEVVECCEVSIDDIVYFIGKIVEEVIDIFVFNEYMVLFDVLFDFDFVSSLFDLLFDDQSQLFDVEVQYCEFEMLMCVWLLWLFDKYWYVIECCFGLNYIELVMFEEFVDEMGFMCECVWQIQQEVLVCFKWFFVFNGVCKDVVL